jgi:ABC-type transport system involved in multi-copper enzyme maturation permease subunit
MLRELRKNFRSIKGIVLFVLAMLGSGAFALLNAYVTRQEREFGKFSEEQRKEGFTLLLKQAYDGDTDIAAFLADAPPILYFVSVATVWFTPMLVAILGYDGISGEVHHPLAAQLVLPREVFWPLDHR